MTPPKNFSVDTDEAQKLADDLMRIRKTMISMKHRFNSYNGKMGAQVVESGLQGFFKNMGDHRKGVDGNLKWCSNLLGRLAQGTLLLDSKFREYAAKDFGEKHTETGGQSPGKSGLGGIEDADIQY